MDFASGAIGFTFGYQEMLKSLIPQLAIGVGTILLAGFNPWVLIPALLSGGLIQALMKVGATNENIKKKVCEKYIHSIRESASDKSDEIAKTVDKKLDKLQMDIGSGLEIEIQGLKNQIQSIIKEMEKKEINVQQELQRLKSIEKELNTLEIEVDDLIFNAASI